MTLIDIDLAQLNLKAVSLGKRGAVTDDAVDANEAILDVDPENVDALLRLLRCRVHRSEFTAAADLVARLGALELDESDQGYVQRLSADAGSWAKREREREEREQAARQERAERVAAVERERTELLASARAVPSTQEARALGAAYRGKDNALAIAFLERGLEIAASWEETLSILAVLAPTYRDSGDLPSALAAYEKAIAIEPAYEANRVVYTSMTATLRRAGRLDEARQHGEQLVGRFPDDPFVLNALGAVYINLALRDADLALSQKAEHCFLRAAEFSPGTRDRLKQLRVFARGLDELYALLVGAGDGEAGAAVASQRQRVEEHLLRLV